MSIQRVCSQDPCTARADESALDAARRMQERGVGTLVVVDDHRKPRGIVTDRDLVLRVIAERRDPALTAVRDVMTPHPHCILGRCQIEDAVMTMRSLGVRRLPVVDADERLVGIVSADDVLALVGEEIANLGRIVGWSRPGVTLTRKRAGTTPNVAYDVPRAVASPGA